MKENYNQLIDDIRKFVKPYMHLSIRKYKNDTVWTANIEDDRQNIYYAYTIGDDNAKSILRLFDECKALKIPIIVCLNN